MICKRKHISSGVLIFDSIAGEEHLLYGYKLHPTRGLPGWEWPGGKHDPGETIEECAKREVCEETGLIVDLQYLTYSEGPNYLCMLFAGRPIDGILELKEPHKHREWKWFHVDEPPSPLVIHTSEALERIKNEFNIRVNRHRNNWFG